MPRPAARRPSVPDRYLDLVRRLPLRPIRSEVELDAAIAMIDSLSDRGVLADEERDYLLVLADLVERYESEQHPMPPVSGAEMLRHLLDARGVTCQDVAAETGVAGPILARILSGKRPLNLRHIEAFARYFHVSPAVFLAD